MTKAMNNKFSGLHIDLKNFFILCKPRVTALIVFTAVIGMFLATPGMVPVDILIASIVGISFVSGAAAAGLSVV